MEDRANALAALPRIDGLLEQAASLVARFGRAPVTAALRSVVDDARRDVVDGGPVPAAAHLVAAAERLLAATYQGPPRRVVNAAGVVVHTNLGRAPLSAAARAALLEAAAYCDLEYDVATGRRGVRSSRIGPLLAGLTGAQDALAVNNGAAALVLALAALAGGREVVVSRGELVEIGGSFRLPDVMASAGVRLREVGTTNRTRAEDYAAGEDAALLLKVHPSNYRMTGFVAAPSVRELAAVGRARGIPLLHDIGSGLLRPGSLAALRDEPDARTSLADGADLVVFSGDKLLGGPQAGLLIGSADLVGRCARHPLARALRLDKLRLAALVATLQQHARDEVGHIPVWAALLHDAAALQQRAERLAHHVGGVVEHGTTLVGGGAAPERGVVSAVVHRKHADAEGIAARLRDGDPPVVVRVADGALIVDLRTVDPEDDELVAQRLAALLG